MGQKICKANDRQITGSFTKNPGLDPGVVAAIRLVHYDLRKPVAKRGPIHAETGALNPVSMIGHQIDVTKCTHET